MNRFFLYLGIGFGIAYLFFMFWPSLRAGKRALVESMAERKAASYCFYGALVSFLIYIYLSTRKIFLAIIAVPLIYIGQIILQLISGAIIRAVFKEP